MLIEPALSPNTGIPHRYTVSFINALIKNMNIFISNVFSYNFELVPIDENSAVDFEFSAIVGDIPVPKIATCSSAQQEMIDLAFNLSMAVQLQHTDYPIWLDEVDKAFDSHHKQKLLDLIRVICDENIVTQIFLTAHHVVISEGLSHADVIALNTDNIVVPEVYNEYVTMN